MTLTVLLFASWADALGSTVTVELPTGSTVASLLSELGTRVKGKALPKPAVAVNQVYARPDTVINASDEVAIIPPVAGG
jgi:molybdopterin converting factor subunit 1